MATGGPPQVSVWQRRESSTVAGQAITCSILFIVAIILAGIATYLAKTALDQNDAQYLEIAELNATDIFLQEEIDAINASLVIVNSTLQGEIDVILGALNLTNGTYLVTINKVPNVAQNINLTSQTPSTLTISSPGSGLIDFYVNAVTSITAGTGLNGGVITGTGTIDLANTAVTAGSYTLASITVDAQGRLTAATSGILPNTTVTPGTYTYGTFTVDPDGRISAASSGTTPVTSITAGTGLNGGTITSTGTIDLADTAVTAGSYTYASLTVDAQGRLTAASSGTSPVTSITAGTGLSGGTITSTGTINLANTAVSAGSYTYTALTVDAQGRLTAASSGTSPVTSITAGTGLNGGTITSTGTIDLANTAVTAGSYTLASITVDAQGRITAAANGTSGGSGTVTSITAGTGLNGGTITTSGTIDLANTAVSAGSYTVASITVDAQGRLTAASSGSVTTIGPTPGGTIASFTSGVASGGVVKFFSTQLGSLQIETLQFSMGTTGVGAFLFTWPAGTLPVSTASDPHQFITGAADENQVAVPLYVIATCALDGGIILQGTSTTAGTNTWHFIATRNHPT